MRRARHPRCLRRRRRGCDRVVRSPPPPDLRPRALHPRADGGDRARGPAPRVGPARLVDRCRPRGHPTERACVSGRCRVAGVGRRPQLPHGRISGSTRSRHGRGRPSFSIGQSEHAYLKASVDQRDRSRLEERARRDREAQIERRSVRRLRGLVAVFASAALVAGIPDHRRDQPGRASRARGADRESAGNWPPRAIANLEVDPERSILLAIEAVRTDSFRRRLRAAPRLRRRSTAPWWRPGSRCRYRTWGERRHGVPRTCSLRPGSTPSRQEAPTQRESSTSGMPRPGGSSARSRGTKVTSMTSRSVRMARRWRRPEAVGC